jgi:formylglycine-generating enzyme required for sulfatase activity
MSPSVVLAVVVLLLGAASIAPASNVGQGGPEPGREAPGPPKEFMGKDGAPMVLIPGGDFVMGSPDEEGYEDEHPEHRVSIAGFYLDKYEVTNARYDKFMEDTGHMRPEYWEQLDLTVQGEFPVVGVAWRDAQAYCEWAEKRLPTEAEWEYAARGGDRRRYPWGNAEPAANLANYGKRWSPKFYKDRLEPVKSFEEGKSPYGIHNMAGNVSEWVADWYEEKYYQGSPKQNPPGPQTGKMKVVRGGSWNFSPQYLRAASRLKFPPISRTADIGVRCARDSQ